MASSLVTNSLIIPCYDMDKSLLNSRAIAPQGERLPLNAGMPPLITLSCLNSSRIAFKDPSTITNHSFKELRADNSGQEKSGLCPVWPRSRLLAAGSRPAAASPAAAGAKRSRSRSPSLFTATGRLSVPFFGSREALQPQPCFQPGRAMHALRRGQQNARLARTPSRAGASAPTWLSVFAHNLPHVHLCAGLRYVI